MAVIRRMTGRCEFWSALQLDLVADAGTLCIIVRHRVAGSSGYAREGRVVNMVLAVADLGADQLDVLVGKVVGDLDPAAGLERLALDSPWIRPPIASSCS